MPTTSKNVLWLEADLVTDLVNFPPAPWRHSGIDLNGHTFTFGRSEAYTFPMLHGTGTAIENTAGIASLSNFNDGVVYAGGRNWVGTWQIDAGTLNISSMWNDRSAGIAINDGGTVVGSAGGAGMHLPKSFVLNGIGDGNGNGALQFSGNLDMTYAWPVTVQTDATFRLTDVGSVFAINGDIDGTGVLTKTGAGKLVVNGTCTAAGITISEGSLGGSGSLTALVMGEGTTLAPGASIGTLTAESASLSGALMVPDGDDVPSVLEIEIIDPEPLVDQGWNNLEAGASLSISATAEQPITVKLLSLAQDPETEEIAPGPLAGFDNTKNYSWGIIRADEITGFDSAAFVVDEAGLLPGIRQGGITPWE